MKIGVIQASSQVTKNQILYDLVCDAALVKHINALSKKPMVDLLNTLDNKLLRKSLERKYIVEYILSYGSEQAILQWINRRM